VATFNKEAAEYLLKEANSDIVKDVSQAFSWSNTPQGHDYWHDINVEHLKRFPR